MFYPQKSVFYSFVCLVVIVISDCLCGKKYQVLNDFGSRSILNLNPAEGGIESQN